ncbi:MAG: phosphatidylserine/phosphatidylglycerophosphate/cardiolipin synthase-like enzyme [Lentimonas sp.]|jgi:phosphatidylserine/phosphatidylglycerophosphate/cardiolipin synthase-like enzyme
MKLLFVFLLGAILGIALLPYALFRQKEMPAGTNLQSPDFAATNAELLMDRTFWDSAAGSPWQQHRIFDFILEDIRSAESFIIADFFLWNPWSGAVEQASALRPLSQELADALIAKKAARPEMPILVLTDPINRIYGRHTPEFYDRMVDAGIAVVFTDLSQLPESNRLYAAQVEFWSKFFSSKTIVAQFAWIPNPFNPVGARLSLSELGRLLYFKANHRKVLISGRSDGAHRLIVGSLNPADGSANHSNLALRVNGAVAHYAAESELSIANWSAQSAHNIHQGRVDLVADTVDGIRRYIAPAVAAPLFEPDALRVAWRSEGAIRQEILMQLDTATTGTRVDLVLFYLSDRLVVQALKDAIRRGVAVRLLLDANRDAFGRAKTGIPNRIVAAELMALSDLHAVEIRWASTHGEQFHPKALRVVGGGQDLVFLGSANWTRRNIGNLNLEANLLLKNAGDLGEAFDDYFESLWGNTDGLEASVPYSAWAETGWSLYWKRSLYHFQEWSGLSTF